MKLLLKSEKMLNERIDSNWKMLLRIDEQLSEDGKIKNRGD